ncbi:hypothetical protein E2C01_064938 [Portunus trituberculatus]|uniref:Uncharacterized protein n=1 Tax=Portunus trituberculatus TaxID=210409 RepID=A0A5B7HKJ1_PORTR|nr:hypothetical protein [Portunus trituberculatus]
MKEGSHAAGGDPRRGKGGIYTLRQSTPDEVHNKSSRLALPRRCIVSPWLINAEMHRYAICHYGNNSLVKTANDRPPHTARTTTQPPTTRPPPTHHPPPLIKCKIIHQ